MGAISTKDGKYYPIVAVITRDGGPARKAEDVIAFKLADGDVVGGEAYAAYMKEHRSVLSKLAQDKLKLDKEANDKLASAFSKFSTAGKEGK